jgi:DNA sulfur modification protein DndB
LQTSKLLPRYESQNAFTFPALRGIQAGKEFYVVMTQLRHIPRIFIFNESEVPPELRAQRILNKSRLPALVNYVLENKDNYVFSALTASIDGEITFSEDENTPNMGVLKIPMDAKLLINDGQHRRAAVERIIQESPELGYESIPVVFFVDTGLSQSQQMFADLNKNSVRPTQSLSILYNQRDGLSREVLSLIEDVSFFRGKIEKEKSSISNRSRKLFTLSAIFSANTHILSNGSQKTISNQQKKFARDYWNYMVQIIEPWKLINEDKLTPKEFREDYTCAHGVLLDALGYLGSWLVQTFPNDWKKHLTTISDIDWRKTSKIWDGVAMINGRMAKTPANVEATFHLLKDKILRSQYE